MYRIQSYGKMDDETSREMLEKYIVLLPRVSNRINHNSWNEARQSRSAVNNTIPTIFPLWTPQSLEGACEFYEGFDVYNRSEEPSWLTDDEIIKVFGTNGTAPTYGITEIDIPDGRVRRDADDVWKLPVSFSDGTRKILNLKRTEGILANSETPVFYAKSQGDSGEITYTPSKDLKYLGDFEFYQDYDHKAAFVMFHDLGRIGGFMEYYRLKSVADKYILVPQKSSQRYHTSGVRVTRRVKREDSLRYQSPETVYPQLLIQVDRPDNKGHMLRALTQMITYWNAVDMLYSNLENPRIKLNIAGFIIPKDDFTTPWITEAQVFDNSEIIDDSVGLRELGSHFSAYSDVFPSDRFDFMISFTSKSLDSSDKRMGIAYIDVDCDYQQDRVALIQNNLFSYIVGAHELGHLLSVDHDQDSTNCHDSSGIMGSTTDGGSENFEWSVCAKESIQIYMSKSKSTCLDNCPETKANCDNAQSPNEITFGCIYDPEELCQQSEMSFSGLDCNDGIMCGSGEQVDQDYCSEEISEEISLMCKLGKGFIPFLENQILPIQDGTVCTLSDPEQWGMCYQGECLPTSADLTEATRCTE